jgi:ankyrin repeat protein
VLWHGSALHLCSFFGLEHIAKRLLKLGYQVNSQDYQGETPLHYAAQYGHGQMARLLLETGQVNVDARDMDSQTLLLLVALKGHEEVAKLLIEMNKVDYDTREEQFSQTPLPWHQIWGMKE